MVTDSVTNRKFAAGYYRVSSQEQSHGYSLDSQREACLRCAYERGYTIVRAFMNEHGESAKTTNRKALRDLLEFLTKDERKIEALFVWKFDRL